MDSVIPEYGFFLPGIFSKVLTKALHTVALVGEKTETEMHFAV